MRLVRPSTVLRIGRSVRTARAAHITLLRVPRLALRSRVCSTSSKEASESLAERAQIDSGFWQGLAVLGGIAALAATPEATKRSAALSAVARYRRLGLDPSLVSDRRLIDDFLRTNIVALGNVLLASPTFYFMWHLIHQQSVATSLMRSVTGSVRIVPFISRSLTRRRTYFWKSLAVPSGRSPSTLRWAASRICLVSRSPIGCILDVEPPK